MDRPSQSPRSGERCSPGTVIDARYRIERHLASGGMADIYEAVQVFIDRPVALKILARRFADDATMVARFEEEARALGRVEHPAVVRVFDSGRTGDGTLYLVMELVTGQSLRRFLETHGPLEVETAVSILTQVLDGLAAAHAEGIVHRDLKPANVMVTETGGGDLAVKVVDFGIARVPPSGEGRRDATTAEGIFVGTPEYLSPEQGLGREVDARSDVYSVGVLAFQLLTGRRPFEHEDVSVLISRHLTEAPPDPVDLRPELAGYPALCAAMMQALEKERGRRHPDAMGFGRALRESLRPGAAATVRPQAPVGGGDLEDLDISLLPEADPDDVHVIEDAFFEEAAPVPSEPGALQRARVTLRRLVARPYLPYTVAAGLTAAASFVLVFAGLGGRMTASEQGPTGPLAFGRPSLTLAPIAIIPASVDLDSEAPYCRVRPPRHFQPAHHPPPVSRIGTPEWAPFQPDPFVPAPVREATSTRLDHLMEDRAPTGRGVRSPENSEADPQRPRRILDPDGLIDPYAE